MLRSRWLALLVLAAAGCSSSASPGSHASLGSQAATTQTSTAAPLGITPLATTSVEAAPSTSTTPTSNTSAPSTTTLRTTLTPSTTVVVPSAVAGQEIGRSVEDRPITLIRRGTPGGTPVLVIGVIHGNEDAGTAIIDDLTNLPVPDGVELFLVPSMNPDGQHDHRRTNAHLVDLNRNFPQTWSPLGEPGDSQYSGPAASSEPETRVIIDLIAQIHPKLVMWYHQNYNRIAPSTGRNGRVRQRYAELTGLSILPITGGTYTGTAAGWAKRALPTGISFIVELGDALSADQALTHARAVLTVAAELSTI